MKLLNLREKLKGIKLEDLEKNTELRNLLMEYSNKMKKFMIFNILIFIILFSLFKEIFDAKYKYFLEGKILFWNKIGFIGGFIIISLTYLLIATIISSKIKDEKIKAILL